MANWRAHPFKVLGKNPRMQFIHEDDVAEAFVRAVRADMPGAYNVVSDDFVRMNDLDEMIGTRFVPFTPEWLALLMAGIGWRVFGHQTHPS